MASVSGKEAQEPGRVSPNFPEARGPIEEGAISIASAGQAIFQSRWHLWLGDLFRFMCGLCIEEAMGSQSPVSIE